MSRECSRSLVQRFSASFICLGLFFFLATGCKNSETTELYHKFQDKNWARFNILSFEIPVKNVDKPCNVYLFARFSPEFRYEKLEFNMVMNTPAGEERINAYQMDVKSPSGAFLAGCKKDSCEGTILLKKELNLGKPGILKIEIENLTPRLTTGGVKGIGIRIEQSGK
jgi:gliding motility-associated lipoprotein GldH